MSINISHNKSLILITLFWYFQAIKYQLLTIYYPLVIDLSKFDFTF